MKPFTLEWWIWMLNYYRERADEMLLCPNKNESKFYFDYYHQVGDWISERIINKYGDNMTKGTISIYKDSSTPKYKWVAKLETSSNIFWAYGRTKEQALAKLGNRI